MVRTTHSRVDVRNAHGCFRLGLRFYIFELEILPHEMQRIVLRTNLRALVVYINEVNVAM
jgi:hypothetical protein